MINNNSQSKDTYLSVIASLVSNVSTQVEGVASVTYEAGLPTKNFSYGKDKKNNAIVINITNNLVTLDIYINVIYGYKIPEVVCNLQEKIKAEIEKNTAYEIKYINVNVVGVLV